MPKSDEYNNCFTPWPDMGQAIRVYATDGPSPTISSHHIIVLYESIMSDENLVIPIQDGREMDKKQNGLGIGNPGDPMYTLDTTGAQSVAYSPTRTMVRIVPDGEDIVDCLAVSDLEKGQTNNQAVGSGLLQVYTTTHDGKMYDVPNTPYLMDAQRTDDFRTYETAPTLCSRMGTGGNNVPVLVVEAE